MDLTDQLRAFVATAQTGSFTRAAENLGTSNRLTSKYVAELESRLKVRLFQRTTRKVGLTPAGEELMARAPALLDELDDLIANVARDSRGLSGLLRISAPVTFGEIYLVGMLARFSEVYPEIKIDLRLNDRFVDLASEGIDIAFRLGHFNLSSLKVRRLGQFESVLVGSPNYIQTQGAPKTPEELPNHSCIIDSNRQNPHRWIFNRSGKDHVARIDGRFIVNSASAAVSLARLGFGLAYVPSFAVQQALETADLVALLKDYAGEYGPVGAVYLEGRTLPRKVRTLIDFALEDVKSTGLLKQR